MNLKRCVAKIAKDASAIVQVASLIFATKAKKTAVLQDVLRKEKTNELYQTYTVWSQQ